MKGGGRRADRGSQLAASCLQAPVDTCLLFAGGGGSAFLRLPQGAVLAAPVSPPGLPEEEEGWEGAAARTPTLWRQVTAKMSVAGMPLRGGPSVSSSSVETGLLS